jgi:hypothetical protein
MAFDETRAPSVMQREICFPADIQAHNLKVRGSNPLPATIAQQRKRPPQIEAAAFVCGHDMGGASAIAAHLRHDLRRDRRDNLLGGRLQVGTGHSRIALVS